MIPNFLLNIWETIISALGQIGTEAAIIALCDVYKNREVIYQEWYHDTLSALTTKAIIEIGTKSAFDIFFENLPDMYLPSGDDLYWLLNYVGKEIESLNRR
ncbi:MAG: hypothetical protein IPL28_08380 [Chloroflexi bacterium]|nr:hypothetical protein [Chloroflexota bacterium]